MEIIDQGPTGEQQFMELPLHAAVERAWEGVITEQAQTRESGQPESDVVQYVARDSEGHNFLLWPADSGFIKVTAMISPKPGAPETLDGKFDVKILHANPLNPVPVRTGFHTSPVGVSGVYGESGQEGVVKDALAGSPLVKEDAAEIIRDRERIRLRKALAVGRVVV